MGFSVPESLAKGVFISEGAELYFSGDCIFAELRAVRNSSPFSGERKVDTTD